MSTQLLDPQTAPDEITAEVATGSASADAGVRFDRSTRQRLLVAEAVACTLESLGDEGSWDRLDPALQAHLLAQARRFEEHVAGLGKQRAVKAVEETALRLKRLERRLGIVVEALEPPKDGRGAASGLFLGDFTEAEREPGAEPGTKRKAGKSKTETRSARASESLKDAGRRFRSRAERMAEKASHRRLHAYVLIALLAVGGTMAWNAKETFTQGRRLQRPPTAAFKMNDYLKEVQVFLPATFTVVKDQDIRVVVAREWLLRSETQRRQDAEGAHVWLSNRNITKMLVTWEDGTPLVRFDGDSAAWYDMTKVGKVMPGAPTSAVSISP